MRLDRAGVLLAILALAGTATAVTSSDAPTIPPTHATALDGHTVQLPAQLPGRVTVLIVGFGRHSANATTAWEKPVRTQLAHPPAVGFYDMAMLAEVPGFVRPWVLRAIRHEVPEVLRPNFLPLTDQEDAWKHAAGYAPGQPEAAYVMVVDQAGHVRWSTHEAFSPGNFAQLRQAVERVENS